MVEKLITSFEELIRRSIAPSVTFFVLALLSDLLFIALKKESVETRLWSYSNLLGQEMRSSAAIFMVVLVVVGLSYCLGAAQQILFDNFLKKDFDPQFVHGASLRSEAAVLTELRRMVRSRIQTEPALARLRGVSEPSDFVLYEIVGGIVPTNTHPYVDSAKAMGIVFVSLIIILIANALLRIHTLQWWSLLLLVLGGACWFFGREVTCAQYRARAVRLYVNFLAMPSKRLSLLLMETDERDLASVGDTKTS